MKKTFLATVFSILWASAALVGPLTAQGAEESLLALDGRFGLGYWSISRDGSHRAAEYEYLNSSTAGNLDVEWAPLPHRFSLETYARNREDYFGSMDYAYRDVVVLNLLSRGLYHNLDHLVFGPDDPTTVSPSFLDLDPQDRYGVATGMHRVFMRLKTPDFPFHLYSEVNQLDKDGKLQQRFLRDFTGGLNKVSQSRDIDWHSEEARVGINSHVGFLEVDYSHMERTFKPEGETVLFDQYVSPVMNVPHNLIPRVESSSDTVKIHTSYTGRFVASGTYATGENRNLDSRTESENSNAAGDLTYMPFTNLVLYVKYRHYEIDRDNPSVFTETWTGLGQTYRVRESIDSEKNLVSGAARYRLTERITLRGEYQFQETSRDRGKQGDFFITSPEGAANFWSLPKETTANTYRFDAAYRIMSRLSFKMDYIRKNVQNPAYVTDPDQVSEARSSLSWTPSPVFSALLSYGTIMERRRDLGPPFTKAFREADRDQALASMTFGLSPRSSITTAYAYFKNSVVQPVQYLTETGSAFTESQVPYADTAHTGSVSAALTLSDMAQLTAEAVKSVSRGKFELDGTAQVTNTSGIAPLSDLKVTETTYSAVLLLDLNVSQAAEFRYSHQTYDDELDNSQDGKSETVLALLTLKW